MEAHARLADHLRRSDHRVVDGDVRGGGGRGVGRLVGFSNGTLERRYARIMLSPPQNMKPYLGHYARVLSFARTVVFSDLDGLRGDRGAVAALHEQHARPGLLRPHQGREVVGDLGAKVRSARVRA